jgi:hypothetical protein
MTAESAQRLLSIARNGQEIGAWPQDQVIAFIRTGQLLGTDSYWHEGMPEWLSITHLVGPPPPAPPKPPPPIPNPSLPPAREGSFRGIGRLQFLTLLVVFVLLAFFVGTIVPQADAGSGLFMSIACIITGCLIACRLVNIGYGTNKVVTYTLLGFLPVLSLVIIVLCLLKPPNSETS